MTKNTTKNTLKQMKGVYHEKHRSHRKSQKRPQLGAQSGGEKVRVATITMLSVLSGGLPLWRNNMV